MRTPGVVTIAGMIAQALILSACVTNEVGRAQELRDGARAYRGKGKAEAQLSHSNDEGDGWTVLVRSADTRVVYVSSRRGSDRNDGLSEHSPKATIAAGKRLLRHGHPDWLLLRKGDVWKESIGQWKTSGRSIQERMVIGSYGHGERPLLETGNTSAFRTSGGGGSPETIDWIAIVGMHFRADGHTGHGGEPGIQLLRGGRGVLVEDCMIERYFTNIVVQGLDGPHHDLIIRRSVIVDAFNVGHSGHPQGIYLDNTHGVIVEGNVIDHNGWSATIRGAVPDIYRHNVYVDYNNSGVAFIGNVVASGSSHGIMMRPGGVANDNLFVRNSIALLLGARANPRAGGVRAEAKRNVILHGKDIDARTPRGWGIDGENLHVAVIADNVIADAAGGQPMAITITGAPERRNNIVIQNNVVLDWGGAIDLRDPGLADTTFVGNDIQDTRSSAPLLMYYPSAPGPRVVFANNRFLSRRAPTDAWMQLRGRSLSLPAWKDAVGDTSSASLEVAYASKNVSVAAYHRSLGRAASLDAFMHEARKQSHDHWQPEYTAAAVNEYVRKSLGTVR